MSMENLQIQRYAHGRTGCRKDATGPYCLFSDTEKFHRIARTKCAENMNLAAEIEDLKQELEVVQTERDELLKEKERAEYSREDYKTDQADLAHSSGESCRLRFRGEERR